MKPKIDIQSSNVSETILKLLSSKLPYLAFYDTYMVKIYAWRIDCYLETIFIHVGQVILPTIWYTIASKFYTHAHVIRIRTEKTLSR